MKAAIILCAIALAGCASPPTYDQLRAKARQDDNDTLCLVAIVKPQYKRVAEDELRDRGASCDWQKVQVMAQAYYARQQASDAAITAVGMQLMQQGQPYAVSPVMPPTTTQCRTVYYQGGAQTVCH